MKKVLFYFATVCLVMGMASCGNKPAATTETTSEETTETKTVEAGVPVGTKAPVFTMNTLSGDSISLEQFRGHFVVLDFWASWCPDCIKETPALVELYNEYHPKGVEFLGISFDTDAEKMTACIEKHQIPWPQVTELKKWKETEINKDYKVEWIPSFYVVCPGGSVKFYGVTAEELAKALPELLAEHEAEGKEHNHDHNHNH